MDFLTHSTIVSPLTRIRQERLLPGKGEVLAKIGQVMSPVQVVARMPLKSNFQVVPACQLLRISAEDLAKNLLINKGDVVEKGTPLVKKRGLGRKEFVSPVDGALYDVVNGRLVFQQVLDMISLRALAHSRVVNRIAGRGVVLEINGSRIQAVWDSGKEGFGILHVAVETAGDPFANKHLESDVSDRVLAVGKITQAEPLEQANHAHISGLIAGSIAADLLPIAKSVSYPIFITDGIGEQGMADPTFQLLQKSEARDMALFNKPPEQSGRRPEIIIPMETIPGENLPLPEQPLASGQTVRILRPPFHNQVGIVVHLYQHTRITSIGTRAYGADVQLSDGQISFVPVANLDAII